MAREAWARTGMVVTIPALLVLILITPNLIGRPPDLQSWPLLVIGLTQDGSTFVVDVGGAVGAYMYASVTLEISGIDNASYSANETDTDTYGKDLRVPENATHAFQVHAYLVDRLNNYFEYNVTTTLVVVEGGRTILVFVLQDESNPREERRTPPDDFRWPVPLRGRL